MSAARPGAGLAVKVAPPSARPRAPPAPSARSGRCPGPAPPLLPRRGGTRAAGGAPAEPPGARTGPARPPGPAEPADRSPGARPGKRGGERGAAAGSERRGSGSPPLAGRGVSRCSERGAEGRPVRRSRHKERLGPRPPQRGRRRARARRPVGVRPRPAPGEAAGPPGALPATAGAGESERGIPGGNKCPIAPGGWEQPAGRGA